MDPPNKRPRRSSPLATSLSCYADVNVKNFNKSHVFQLDNKPAAPALRTIQVKNQEEAVLNLVLCDKDAKTFELTAWSEKAIKLYETISAASNFPVWIRFSMLKKTGIKAAYIPRTMVKDSKLSCQDSAFDLVSIPFNVVKQAEMKQMVEIVPTFEEGNPETFLSIDDVIKGLTKRGITKCFENIHLEIIAPVYMENKHLFIADCSDGIMKARLELKCTQKTADILQDEVNIISHSFKAGFLIPDETIFGICSDPIFTIKISDAIQVTKNAVNYGQLDDLKMLEYPEVPKL